MKHLVSMILYKKPIKAQSSSKFDFDVDLKKEANTDRDNTTVTTDVNLRKKILEINDDYKNLDEIEFREKHNGMSKHRFKMDTDPVYANATMKGISELAKQSGSIDYPITNVNRGTNPNNMFMAGVLTDTKLIKNKAEANLEAIGSALPIPLLEEVRGVKSINSLIKSKLNPKNIINNIHKINPLAFKPNLGAYYRGIGKEGLSDAIRTKALRVNQNPKWENVLGGGHNVALSSPYFFKGTNFAGVKHYNSEVIAEVVDQTMRSRAISRMIGAGDKSVYQPVKELYKMGRTSVVKKIPRIPLGDNVKFYEPHWLKGYREISKPARRVHTHRI